MQREHKHREKAKDTVFTEDAGKVFTENCASEFTGSEKLKKKQKQAQKAAEKVKKARGKLPKKREYTLQRVFDEETGKGKYVVVPLDKEKPFKQESLSKTTMRRMQTESRNFVHGKIAENEKENSAVEGAHKTEQKGEELIGFVKRHYKGKEARQRAKIAKLEKKQFQKEVNFKYQKFLEGNPQMQKKALQKRLQKQRIKREYMKARQKGAATKAAQEAVSKTANTATAIAKKLQEFASKNAGVLITVAIMAVLLIMVMTSVSSCGAMFADTQSTVLAASYLSEPAEIDATDLQFTRLELDLQNEIDNIETDYPGYDEYSYNLGEIGHNPFTLIGYLSAAHETLSELAESIKEFGIVTPIITRPKEDGNGYEVIAGQRRVRASELAGINTVPAFVLPLDRDRAIITLVDSNLQRENILPSERAFAYRMKSEAMKRQGFRTDLTSSQVVTKLRTDDKVAQGFGVGRMTVQRFIRLTELIPPILQMVDEGKIALTPAVELSFLKKDEQENLFATMESEEATPSLSQAQRMKSMSQSGQLDMDMIFSIMTEEKGNQKETLKINTSKLKKYFPKDTTPKQMEETIIRLLERELQRKRSRDSR